MAALNKIQLASEMFVEAHARYTSARRDIDYVTSILLSGAVVGIVSPLLKEQGGHTMHELLTRIGNLIAEPGEEAAHEGVFREIYNSLKHAGNKNKNIQPSSDLEIQTDLKKEAAHMLDAAKHDFREIEALPQVREGLSKGFLSFLEADADYA
jgi:hypothetical protein